MNSTEFWVLQSLPDFVGLVLPDDSQHFPFPFAFPIFVTYTVLLLLVLCRLDSSKLSWSLSLSTGLVVLLSQMHATISPSICLLLDSETLADIWMQLQWSLDTLSACPPHQDPVTFNKSLPQSTTVLHCFLLFIIFIKSPLASSASDADPSLFHPPRKVHCIIS